jgi:hypothetical protein
VPERLQLVHCRLREILVGQDTRHTYAASCSAISRSISSAWTRA